MAGQYLKAYMLQLKHVQKSCYHQSSVINKQFSNNFAQFSKFCLDMKRNIYRKSLSPLQSGSDYYPIPEKCMGLSTRQGYIKNPKTTQFTYLQLSEVVACITKEPTRISLFCWKRLLETNCLDSLHLCCSVPLDCETDKTLGHFYFKLSKTLLLTVNETLSMFTNLQGRPKSVQNSQLTWKMKTKPSNSDSFNQ